MGEKMNQPKNEVKPGIRRYLSKIGRKGGLVKSESKAQAVRLNGLKGGRPKKPSLSLEHGTNPKENGFQG
jgi:hypothetical protein